VEAVQRRVSGNWLQASVDPGIQFAPRAVVEFQIMRDGKISNIQITKSSGNSSVDTSIVRAVQGSSQVQPLPNEYSGRYVNVEFWFDFKR
jgi:protein TonB